MSIIILWSGLNPPRRYCLERPKVYLEKQDLLLSYTRYPTVPGYSVFVQRHVAANSYAQTRVSLAESKQNETTHTRARTRTNIFARKDTPTSAKLALVDPHLPSLDYIRRNCKNRVIVVPAHHRRPLDFSKIN